MHDGDDLLQAACERAWRRRHDLRDPDRIAGWMFQIVRTAWIDEKRRDRHRPRSAEDGEELSIQGGDAQRELAARLDLDQTAQAIWRLSDNHRSVLMLVGVEGCSYREASEILGIPIGTVMSRLARARETLGAALDGGPPIGGDEP